LPISIQAGEHSGDLDTNGDGYWETMKTPFSIIAAVLLIGSAGAFCSGQAGASDRDRLVGAWKLVGLEQPGPDGKLNRIECSGMFVFTRDGQLSVQVTP
jgi:hypothetical protein